MSTTISETTTEAGVNSIQIGQAPTDLIGHYGVAPVAQRSGAAQTALTDSTGSTPAATLAAITAGASYAQADIVAIKNALGGIVVLLNELRAAILAIGIIKGS